jgi:hypothetical protein
MIEKGVAVGVILGLLYFSMVGLDEQGVDDEQA